MSPCIEVISRGDLARTDEGPTRGYAHIGFDDHPAQAPGHLELGPLLLVADGEMLAGEGLPMHEHAAVENVLLMRSGQLCHEDAQGNAAILGDEALMVMSAGCGTAHSEFVYGEAPVRALVIHMRPDDAARDAEPCVRVANAPRAQRRDRWRTLASGRSDRPDGALALRCDAELRAAVLTAGAIVSHDVAEGSRAYLVACGGPVEVNGRLVDAGDRVLVREGGTRLEIEAREDGEVVLLSLS